MAMEKLKQDLNETKDILIDAQNAACDDKFARAYYTCHLWGVNRLIDMVDFARFVKRFCASNKKNQGR